MIEFGRHFQPMSQDRYDPEHWREGAEKARAQAEQMNNEGSRDVLLCIANSHDMMAQHAAWLRGD
jgi:hypothetical protein